MIKTLLFCSFYLIAIPVAFISPLILRILIFGLNCIIPDPVPYADELLMGAAVISKMKTAATIAEHPTRFKLLLVLGIILIGLFLYYFISSSL